MSLFIARATSLRLSRPVMTPAGRPLPPPSLITMVSGLSLRRSMLAASTDAKLRRYTIARDEILNDVRTPGRRCSVVIGRSHRVSSIRSSPVPAPVHRRPLSSGQLGPVPSLRVYVSRHMYALNAVTERRYRSSRVLIIACCVRTRRARRTRTAQWKLWNSN